MLPVFLTTFKGVVRDRVLRGVLATSLLFLTIPPLSTFSMRQVAELSMTLSLGLYSFILLLLTVFLGATSLWKDFERRYTYSVLGLPLSRTTYLLGKYCGMAGFIIVAAAIMAAATCCVVWLTASLYPPPQPVAWGTLLLAETFLLLKYLLLLGFAFLFSTVSTSFFLPVFGTITTYLAGNVTQEVYDYLQTEMAVKTLTPMARALAEFLYYLLPNFGAFDLQVQAIYRLGLDSSGLLLTVAYAIIYLAILLACAATVFRRRELV